MTTYTGANDAFTEQFATSSDCKLAFVAAEKNATQAGAEPEVAKNFALLIGLQNDCTTDDLLHMKTAYEVGKLLNIQAGDHGVAGETLLDPLDE